MSAVRDILSAIMAIKDAGAVAILLVVVCGLGYLYYLERKRADILMTAIMEHGEDVTEAFVAANKAIRSVGRRCAKLERKQRGEE